MKVRHWYIVLCVLGTVLPYSQFIPFLREHGLAVDLFIEQLFANRISSFFGLDLVVSSIVLWIWVLVDRGRYGVRHAWAPLLANVVVGVSLGLPLWLYLRDRQMQYGSTTASA